MWSPRPPRGSSHGGGSSRPWLGAATLGLQEGVGDGLSPLGQRYVARRGPSGSGLARAPRDLTSCGLRGSLALGSPWGLSEGFVALTGKGCCMPTLGEHRLGASFCPETGRPGVPRDGEREGRRMLGAYGRGRRARSQSSPGLSSQHPHTVQGHWNLAESRLPQPALTRWRRRLRLRPDPRGTAPPDAGDTGLPLGCALPGGRGVGGHLHGTWARLRPVAQ